MKNFDEELSIKHLDLFSGIGGFALAANWAGFQTVGFCEIESYCRQVLKKHWPEVPIHNDVRELDGSDYGAIDLITGGYPCQPFSLAGNRKGHNDHRHLWPEMLRVITQARPTWVVAENVVGHITMGLDQVLADLESEGYSARPVVIPACAIDAPHRRDRVWIIAHTNPSDSRQGGGEQSKGEEPGGIRQGVLADAISGERNSGPKHPRREERRDVGQRGEAARTMANTQSQHDRGCNACQIGRQKSQSGNSCSEDTMANTNTTRPQERQTLPRDQIQTGPTLEREAAQRAGWWPTEPGVGRVANGIPRRVDRIKGLGNAIVPQVAFQILKAIADDLSPPAEPVRN